MENEPKAEETTEQPVNPESRPSFVFEEHVEKLWKLIQEPCNRDQFKVELEMTILDFQRAHAWILSRQMRLIQAKAMEKIESLVGAKKTESKLDEATGNQ